MATTAEQNYGGLTMSSADDTPVAIIDVRMELGDTGGHLDEGLIEYHLGRATKHVRKNAPATPDDELEDAIALEAAWRVVTSSKAAFIESKEAAEVSKDWDVDEYISNLKERRDDELDDVAESWAVTVSDDGITPIY